MPAAEEPPFQAAGLAYAAAAFFSWGIVPVYWKQVAYVPSYEIVLHRIVWSALLLAMVLAWRGRLGELAAALRDAPTRAILAATTILIGANWFMFIWAVNTGHLLDSSLGYFLTPIINVALGVFFLKERLRAAQLAAVGLAAAGVGAAVLSHGRFPWLALALAATFGIYGLLRKLVKVDALLGLSAETILLAPPAAAALFFLHRRGGLSFFRDGFTQAMLIGAAPVTALPLLWFAHGARRLPLKTLAFVQFLSPSCQFAIAVAVYGEPLSPAKLLTFALIWAAALVYAIDAAISTAKGRSLPSASAS